MFGFVVFIIALTFLTSSLGKTVELYVSPNGSDSNTGLDVHYPVKTLHRVLQLLETPNIKGNTINVELMTGYYDLPATLHFTHAYQSPVTFRAYQGQEVHVTGGRRLPVNHFKGVTDTALLRLWGKEAQRHIKQINLPSVGISDYGNLSSYGWYVYRQAPLELFINGQPLTLAKWPNHDFIDITAVQSQYGYQFSYNTNRDSRWANEKEPWAYGFWYWSWADLSLKIRKIDTVNHTITLAAKDRHGMRAGVYNHGNLTGITDQGGYFRVMNMLSELDEPGEYYIDRSTGILYVWPNTPTGALTSSDVVYASMVDDCIKLDPGVSNLRFEDFTLEACRKFGINAQNVSNLELRQLELKNTGSYVFHCGGDCRSVTVSRCEIHDGDGGIDLFGGDRVNLIASGNVVEDNHIWRYSREGAVGQNAIHSVGVNNLIRYNHIHDGQYAAIKFDGNDHVMEYNHVHHNCVNASDCGALHATRSWSFRGNKVRYNHIHDTIRLMPGSGVRGVMLDDQYSSVTIEHNVFYRNDIHANIGGGRDNIIRYNVMYDSVSESIQVDARGSSPHFDVHRILDRDLASVPYQNDLWRSKYPEMSTLQTGTRLYPEGNQIYKNIFWNKGNQKGILYFQPNFAYKRYFDVSDNHMELQKSNFYAPDDSDFRLRCGAKQWANGVNFEEPISLKDVGPRQSTGPTYMKTALPIFQPLPTPQPCDQSTVAPETKIPATPYISDGSGPNALYPNITDGCWFITGQCPRHPRSHMFRDTGEQKNASMWTREARCLSRAVDEWKYCGSSSSHHVTAVFGPTGAMTIAGSGCYNAFEQCPKHYAPPGLHHDVYAEQAQNASTDVEGCLSRARAQWAYCGSYRQYPVTSIFLPTGTVRTAGGGCWIKISSCPADKQLKPFFYDAWGATNIGSDDLDDNCFERATYFWQHCGSHRNLPVTAYFRPQATERTVPASIERSTDIK
ncbi:uncharacterized protein LOC124137802 [Haliotis rufescens]|uniref:uncharacterized protein LOC124137802 n=1 Tax=Haliotis rufescens TaxID=6454 RepID=UPI00201F7973|nr:uncharacterized protein LOC124137802 [Haliotis rufescens]